MKVEVEKYFIDSFDIKNAMINVKIFSEEMNCNKLRYTFTFGEIYVGCSIWQNERFFISHYDLYSNLLSGKWRKMLSEKIEQQLQRNDVIKLLNDAIIAEKKRIERIHRRTESQYLLKNNPCGE